MSNTYAKYCPNVFLAKCDQLYKRGDIIPVTTKYGKDNDSIVFNLIFERDGFYYYSIVREDGFNVQEWAKKRAEKLENAATNATKRSSNWYEKSNEGKDFLALGEPIKIGHHSEKRHRALIERNNARMDNCVKESNKAEDYQRRAEYWNNQTEIINLSMPESMEYFEFKLEEVKKHHAGLKDGSIEREHSMSLQYANKAVKDTQKNYEIALKLWGDVAEDIPPNLPQVETVETVESTMSYLFINNEKINYKMQWVKASALITNSNQTRNRNDVGSLAQINQIASNLQPELLGNSFELASGAPVIDTNNQIISGHGRIEAIKQAFYQDKYGKYADYNIHLQRDVHYCNEAHIPRSLKECYILCRVIAAHHNTIEAVHAANNATLSYTPYEIAKINSKRLKPSIEQFIASLPLLEQSQYFTDGILNLKAFQDFQNARIIAALPNCTILADFINYPNPDFKNVITAILNNIDKILEIQANNVELFDQFALALDKFLQIKQSGGNVEDFLLQLDMFDSGLNGADFSNCLSILWQNTRSAKALTSELAIFLNQQTNLDLFDTLETEIISDTYGIHANENHSQLDFSNISIEPTPTPPVLKMRITFNNVTKYIEANGNSYKLVKNTYSTKFSYGKSFKYELIKRKSFDGADVIVNKSNSLRDLIFEFPYFSDFFILDNNITQVPPIQSCQKIIPRDWQAEIMDKVITAPEQSLVVNAPTGAGKMVFIMLLVQYYLQFNKPMLILVDRIALIKQLSECATKYGISHNIIQSKNSINIGSMVTIVSVQSYDYTLPPPEYLFIDECHSLYNKVAELIPKAAKAIGFTATAITKGLGLVYKRVINATTAQILTRNGILTPFNVLYMQKIDMTNAKLVAGEYSAIEVQKRSAKIYGDVVEMYQRHTPLGRGIVFCATKTHCEEVAALFTAQGIAVGVYTSSTKEADRAELLRQFDDNEIKLLISVSALSKGFDKGYIEVIMDLRPLRRSLAEYIQVIGRGLRQYPNKTNCIVLDFSGNWERFACDYENIFVHGVPTDLNDEYMQFNRPRGDYESDTIDCPCCGSKIAHNCIKCGYKRYPRIGITVEVDNIEAIELPALDLSSDDVMHPLPPPLVPKFSILNKVKQFLRI